MGDTAPLSGPESGCQPVLGAQPVPSERKAIRTVEALHLVSVLEWKGGARGHDAERTSEWLHGESGMVERMMLGPIIHLKGGALTETTSCPLSQQS